MATILVVDDSAVDRRMAGGLLEKNLDYAVRYAENGLAAMTAIGEDLPILVLTDMQMPEMDGLELVSAIRFQYPDVPVVLMTAHGSEDIAVAALEQGAASYVPKSQLSEKLVETVEQIVSLSGAESNYERLIECMDATTFKFSLKNDPTLVDPLIELVQQILSSMDLCDRTGQLQMGVALEHALLNAMYRGNLEISVEDLKAAREKMITGKGVDLVEQRRAEEPYKDRTVRIDISLSPDEARFEVCDQGPGFDVAAAQKADPAEALGAERGRGLLLMRKFMDEVTFNESGNQVTMVKRRHPA